MLATFIWVFVEEILFPLDIRLAITVNNLLEFGNGLLRDRICMIGRRKFPALDFSFVLLDPLERFAPNIAIHFDELGEESPGWKVSGHINLDKHLS